MTARTKAMTTPLVTHEDFEPDAYCLRTCDADGTSYGNFRWPLEIGAIVTCPDWKPTANCSNGLHGLLDGIGDWSLIKPHDGARIWLVVGVIREEVIAIDDNKVKFPRAKIIYAGSPGGALGFIQPHTIAAIQKAAEGNVATGYRGHAAATGNGGHAAATGDSGHAAATGDYGHAAATGDYGHAAATGLHSIAASLGYAATAEAADGDWIVLAAYDDNGELVNVRTGKIGTENLRPHIRYRLSQKGKFEEAAQ